MIRTSVTCAALALILTGNQAAAQEAQRSAYHDFHAVTLLLDPLLALPLNLGNLCGREHRATDQDDAVRRLYKLLLRIVRHIYFLLAVSPFAYSPMRDDIWSSGGSS